MKKINHYGGSPADFITEFIQSRGEERRTKGLALLSDMLDSSNTYVRLFQTDNLASLEKNAHISDEDKMFLESLYSNELKPLRELKDTLTTVGDNRKMVYCPYCMLPNEISDLDHIVPKKEMPIFSIHPLNLYPCCSKCNRKKLDRWRKDGEMLFLNLYIDDPKQLDYLEVDIHTCNGLIKNVVFSIRNLNNIEATIFSKISNHFNKLDICSRYKVKAMSEIDEIVSDTKSKLKEGIDIEINKKLMRNKGVQLQEKYGTSFWRAKIYLALVEIIDSVV